VREAGNRIYSLDAEVSRIAERQLFPRELPPRGDATLFAAGGREKTPLDLPLIRFARGEKDCSLSVSRKGSPRGTSGSAA
jgi:hypothetical protein